MHLTSTKYYIFIYAIWLTVILLMQILYMGNFYCFLRDLDTSQVFYLSKDTKDRWHFYIVFSVSNERWIAEK